MSYISQGCYDMNAGTQRVLRILVRHQMKGTFCMVGKTAEDVARWWLKNQDQR
jgi:peptidoglycan/xylan/chitin deacetylase (PgdA/CDA1 family)